MIIGKEELERIEELKRNEELLYACIDYLQQLWEIGHNDIKANFNNIGFTNEDIERLEIEVE